MGITQQITENALRYFLLHLLRLHDLFQTHARTQYSLSALHIFENMLYVPSRDQPICHFK